MNYFVYKTTNTINNKFYIGVHNGKKPNYIGSGFALQRAIKKYGKDNFVRETLAEFDTSEEAYEYEAWLVNDYMINRPDCYNLCNGGLGGVSGYGYEMTDEIRSKMSTSAKLRGDNGQIQAMRMANIGKPRSQGVKDKISESNSGRVFTKEHRAKIKEKRKYQTFSKETRDKISMKHKNKTHTQISCPHCDKSGGLSAMHRWHMDNCRYINSKEHLGESE